MQERQFIRDQIAAGKTKDEIKAALVDEYGEQVLADPGTGGFNVTLWVVPILAALRRARRDRLRRPHAGGAAARRAEPELPPPLSAEDARRLDAELSR